MKREIKFRIWDGLLSRMFKSPVYCMELLCDIVANVASKMYVPMQYTGLKDKDGIEIYEDDILKDGKGNIFRVYGVDGGFVIKASVWLKDLSEFKDMDYLVSEPLSCPQLQSVICYQCVVIGNIHQNPELLVPKI